MTTYYTILMLSNYSKKYIGFNKFIVKRRNVRGGLVNIYFRPIADSAR